MDIKQEILKIAKTLSVRSIKTAAAKRVELKPLPQNNFMNGIKQDYMIYFDGKPWGKLYFNMRGYVAEKGIPIPSDRTPNGVAGLSIGEKSLSTYKSEIINANRIWDNKSGK